MTHQEVRYDREFLEWWCTSKEARHIVPHIPMHLAERIWLASRTKNTCVDPKTSPTYKCQFEETNSGDCVLDHNLPTLCKIANLIWHKSNCHYWRKADI